MRSIFYSVLVSVILSGIIFFAGCGGSYEQQKDDTTGTPKDTVKPVESYYKIIYQKDDGIFTFNTYTKSDKSILKLSSKARLEIIPSPSGINIVFPVTDPDKKGIKIYSYNIAADKLTTIKSLNKTYSVRIFWKDDNSIFLNYYETKKGTIDKSMTLFIGFTELIDVNKNKVISSIKPRTGDVLHSNILNKQLVFSDETNFYIFDIQKNKIVRELPELLTADRSTLAFSPDGNKYFSIEIKKRKDQNGNIYKYNELYLGSVENRKDKLILDFNYDPQNIFWSPDSKFIMCDVVSPNLANLRSICLYDISSGKIILKGEENTEKLRNGIKAFYSPGGKYISMQYTAEDTTSFKEYFVIRQCDNDSEEEIKADNMKFEKWISDDILLFSNSENNYLYNRETKTGYPFSSGKILFAGLEK